MIRFVVDASVVLKWVVQETGSAEAEALRWADQLLAPDLILAECGNAIWKKVRRGEFTRDEAGLAIRLLEQSDIELRPMRNLIVTAVDLSIALDHPAYDCVYLALAEAEQRPFVTADEALVRKLASSGRFSPRAVTLGEAAAMVKRP